MRKILLPLILFVLVACSQKVENTTIGSLTLPANPHAGNRIDITYQLDSNAATSEQQMQDVTLYYSVKGDIYAQDVSFSEKNDVLKGSVHLPDSAQAFALKFEGKVADEHGKDYIFSVKDHSGEDIAGAKAGKSLFYNGLGSYLLGIDALPDSALTLMKSDFETHPDIKRYWMSPYLNALLTAKGEEAKPQVKKELRTFLADDDPKESEYNMAVNIFSKLKENELSDSVKNVVLEKFPKGTLAQRKAFSNFNQQSDLTEMKKAYEDFKTTFGKENAKDWLNNMAGKIAQKAFEQKDKAGFWKYSEQMTHPIRRASIYNSIAWELVEQDKDLAFADSVSKKSLDLVQKAIDQPGDEKPSYFSQKQWKERMESSYAGFADTYAAILFKEDQIDNALKYQKEAVDLKDNSNSEINQRYVKYLMAAKDFATAKKELEEAYIQGQSNPEMDEYLKTAYKNVNQSEEGYDAYLEDLRQKGKEHVKEELTKQMINKPASKFTLPDLAGNAVSLESLKGKVVILDFWATWCGPCKASFPGMQMAVNQFEKDSNVVFLFINTAENMEAEKRHKSVGGFIQDHDYTFHVLMDQKNGEKGQYEVINAYEVSGIPTKFIIGTDGNIKFKKVGFGGNSEAEAKEIAIMIEMAGA